MARFINADSYLKNFCNRFCSVKECTATQKKDCCIAISLAAEPTAFDVDKVVEQLEEEIECFMSDIGECSYTVAYRNAIEIVKAGGS